MTDEFARVRPQRRTGTEHFRDGPHELDLTLHDFWCWSTSDLVSNTTRGVLAEFLVANAVGVPMSGVRDPWAAYDLETPDGIRIEVKSAARLQSWAQQSHSRIVFGVQESRSWNPDTNEFAAERKRQAHVYVFALLGHTTKETVDPLDISQWSFYVLSTKVLNERATSRRSISLKTLEALSGGPVLFEALARAIRREANANLEQAKQPTSSGT